MKALCIYNDFHHPGALVKNGLEEFAPPEISIEFTDAEDGIPTDFPTNCGILILSKANMTASDKETSWVTRDWEIHIRDFVENGGMLLAVHSGIAGYEKGGIMGNLLGGTFKWHPEICDVSYRGSIKIGRTGIGSVDFTCRDEHYFVDVFNKDAEIFLTSESRHGRQPAGWICNIERGRVVVLTPGHTLEVWNHPVFRKMILQALQTKKKAAPAALSPRQKNATAEKPNNPSRKSSMTDRTSGA
ncbi:MAG: ThuA domain-containing protein [Spirochaetaceae bacterium]|nr:ThuA domain-containing protein [Spirochaetaceae bacterium]MDT8297436.1 ThuA domain-containing protein [Spirochaetaceae bacterium]